MAEKPNNSNSQPPSSQPASASAASGGASGNVVLNFDPSKKLSELNLEDKKQLVEAAVQSLHKQAAAHKLASLPAPIRGRVKALNKLHDDAKTLERKMEEEIEAVRKKYFELKAPLHAKRSAIVVGAYEPKPDEIPPESEMEKKALELAAAGELTAEDLPKDAKGIPEFWLQALTHYEQWMDLATDVCPITERDVEALKHLVDIRCVRDDDKGFQLEFEFRENPFFSNKVLTKSYVVSTEDVYNESTFDHAEGCQINWLPGKNLTVKMVQKRPKNNRRRGGGGGGNQRVITSEEPCESFFNFFSPISVPENEELDEEQEHEFGELLELDYELGVMLKDRLIPHAVAWYTGEAVSLPMPGVDDDEEEDEENDDDEEDDEEEEEEVAPVTVVMGRGRGGRGGGGRGGHGGHGGHAHSHDHDHDHDHGTSPPSRGGRGGRGGGGRGGRGGGAGAPAPTAPKGGGNAPGQPGAPECKQS